MRTPLLALIASILVASTSFALVVLRLDPHSGPGAPVVFFATLFLALAGVCALLVFGLRVWFTRGSIVHRSLRRAFREGLLIAAAATLLLVFQAYRVLTWWAMLLVAIVTALLLLATNTTTTDEPRVRPRA